MNETYLGTILAFGFSFTPRGFQPCLGQLMSISQNSALFSLLGTTFGGDGQSTFGLPDLRGRTLIGQGQGIGLSTIVPGEMSGTENTSLLITNMPAHTHALVPGQATITTVLNAISGTTITNDPDSGNNSFGASGNTPNIYSEPGGTSNGVGGITSAIGGTTGIAGGSQPFSIRNPYLGINYCIAVSGIFPSRN
ncbi:phage tail protein [Flavobacterium sp. LC2016-12]|uniref:phage tail protein n=1 Tax=Flavobacterium sp. LC2016-12 TaxID=2783794 RepID=UPI00188A0E92|nr:tail fiber protein [Flavobacterium sp. LC2016-12]MBF4465044.1 tail fiber protein [Flavobacterium sp. LC2016-12]